MAYAATLRFFLCASVLPNRISCIFPAHFSFTVSIFLMYHHIRLQKIQQLLIGIHPRPLTARLNLFQIRKLTYLCVSL